jgi:hypothetical protein
VNELSTVHTIFSLSQILESSILHYGEPGSPRLCEFQVFAWPRFLPNPKLQAACAMLPKVVFFFSSFH